MVTPKHDDLIGLALSARRSGIADRVFIRDDEGELIGALDWIERWQRVYDAALHRTDDEAWLRAYYNTHEPDDNGISSYSEDSERP